MSAPAYPASCDIEGQVLVFRSKRGGIAMFPLGSGHIGVENLVCRDAFAKSYLMNSKEEFEEGSAGA